MPSLPSVFVPLRFHHHPPTSLLMTCFTLNAPIEAFARMEEDDLRFDRATRRYSEPPPPYTSVERVQLLRQLPHPQRNARQLVDITWLFFCQLVVSGREMTTRMSSASITPTSSVMYVLQPKINGRTFFTPPMSFPCSAFFPLLFILPFFCILPRNCRFPLQDSHWRHRNGIYGGGWIFGVEKNRLAKNLSLVLFDAADE